MRYCRSTHLALGQTQFGPRLLGHYERMHKRRGQSFYAEFLDPSSKKFLNQCGMCGRVGLSPRALDSDFDMVQEQKTVKRDVKGAKLRQKAVVDILRRDYDPLPLDKLGHCDMCAIAAESELPEA